MNSCTFSGVAWTWWGQSQRLDDLTPPKSLYSSQRSNCRDSWFSSMVISQIRSLILFKSGTFYRTLYPLLRITGMMSNTPYQLLLQSPVQKSFLYRRKPSNSSDEHNDADRSRDVVHVLASNRVDRREVERDTSKEQVCQANKVDSYRYKSLHRPWTSKLSVCSAETRDEANEQRHGIGKVEPLSNNCDDGVESSDCSKVNAVESHLDHCS